MNREDDIIQLVVHCNHENKACTALSPLFRIKYCLPMIDACVVENQEKRYRKSKVIILY